jgi:hypothetical protein
MIVAQRVHPACRSGEWQPLFTNARIFAYEATVHAVFGAVLGLLLAQDAE